MIFVVLAAIAFSLNDVYLAVEFSLVLILASSPAFLAAARCAKHASATGERKINKSIKFAFLLYFRLISYVFLLACWPTSRGRSRRNTSRSKNSLISGTRDTQ